MTDRQRRRDTSEDTGWVGRKALKVQTKFEEGAMPRGTSVLYRHPMAGVVLGAALFIGFGVAGIHELGEWAEAPGEPVTVNGAPGSQHLGHWIRWNRHGMTCARTVAIAGGAGRVFYRPVAVPGNRVIWLAGSKLAKCDGTDSGELEEAKGTNGDALRETARTKSHWVYWVGQGPSNRLVGALVALPFSLLGLFVAGWYATVGRRVHALRRTAA